MTGRSRNRIGGKPNPEQSRAQSANSSTFGRLTLAGMMNVGFRSGCGRHDQTQANGKFQHLRTLTVSGAERPALVGSGHGLKQVANGGFALLLENSFP